MRQCIKMSGIELKKQSAEPQCEGNPTQREHPLDLVYLPKQRGTTHRQVRRVVVVGGGLLLHILAETGLFFLLLFLLSLMPTGFYTHTKLNGSLQRTLAFVLLKLIIEGF